MIVVDTVSMMWLEGMDPVLQETRKTTMEHHCSTNVPMEPLSLTNVSGLFLSVHPNTPG